MASRESSTCPRTRLTQSVTPAPMSSPATPCTDLSPHPCTASAHTPVAQPVPSTNPIPPQNSTNHASTEHLRKKMTRSERFVADNLANILPETSRRPEPRHEHQQRPSQSNPLQPSTSSETPHYINFDGACRTPQLASAGVFHSSYAHPLSRATILTGECTNNIAEITACLMAMTDILSMDTNKPYIIRGDANYVIATITSGRLLKFHSRDKSANSALWLKLQTLWTQLLERGYSVTLQWVPRYRNREPDELCNAVLDKRPADHSITSSCTTPEELDMTLAKCLRNLTEYRHPTLRTIPTTLQAHWISLITAILTNPLYTDNQRFSLFAIAPHLISTEGTRLMNRADYKRLRQHFTLLLDHEYLCNTLASLCNPPSQRSNETQQPNPVSLIRRGACAQLLNDPLGTPPAHDELCAKIAEQFPSKNLPDPLPIPQSRPPTVISAHELLRSALRTRKGKAPSLSGWTRELFVPLLLHPTEATKLELEKFFMKLANVSLSTPLLLYLTTTPCTPIVTDKTRPICLRDYLLKVTVRCLLDRITPSDTNLNHTSSTFNRRGGSTLLGPMIQAALDEGENVIALDSSNAYNEVSRLKAFIYLMKNAHIYGDMFPLINLLYSHATPIHLYHPITRRLSFAHSSTTGTVQGCPTSTWFFTIALHADVLLPFRTVSTSFVDDIYLVRDAISNLAPITEALKSCDLKLNIAKCRFISPRPPPSALTVSMKHEKTTSRIAGGYVVVDRQLSSDRLADSLKHVLTGFRKKIDRIMQLGIPLHYKLSLFQFVQWSLIYAVTASTTPCARLIASTADELNIQAFMRATKVSSESLHVQYFTSSQDGGWNVFPLSLAQPHLLQRHIVQINTLLKQLNLRLIPISPSNLSTIRSIWSHVTHDLPRKRPFLNSYFFATTPRLHALSLSDDAFRFALLLHMDEIESFDYTCRHSNVPLQGLTNQERFKHILACSSCGAPTFHARHRAIVESITSTCRRHCIAVEPNPRDLPRVGNSRGGADILLWRGTDWYSIDVTISKKPDAAYLRKEALYARYAILTNSITLPAAISPYGQIHRSTWQAFLKIATGTRGFISDLNLHIQHALIIGQFNGITRLQARQDQPTTDYSAMTFDELQDAD